MQNDIGFSVARLKAIQKHKVLAVTVSPLGDCVLALPTYQAIRDKHPDSHFEIMANRAIVPMFKLMNLADDYHGFPVGINNHPEAREAYFSCFDKVYCFLNHEFRTDKDMERLPKSNDSNLPFGKYCLDGFGFSGDHTPHIVINSEKKSPPLIAIHAGAMSIPRWPTDKWINLCIKLSRDYRLLLIGGNQDAYGMKSLMAPVKKDRVETAVNLPLDELCRLLATCTGFVAQDSGPGHLCAAVGLPGVVLHFKWYEHMQVWANPSSKVQTINGLKAQSQDAIDALKQCLTL